MPSFAEAKVNEEHVETVMASAAAADLNLDVKFFEHRPLVLAMVVAAVLDQLAHPLLPQETVDVILTRGTSSEGFGDADIEIIERQVESKTRGIQAACCHLALLKQVLSPIAKLIAQGSHENARDLCTIFVPHLARMQASPLTLDMVRATLTAAVATLSTRLVPQAEGTAATKGDGEGSGGVEPESLL